MVKSPLCLGAALVALSLCLSPAHAADPLTVESKQTNVFWNPNPKLSVRLGFAVAELGPHDDHPDRIVWKNPPLTPSSGSPAASGQKLVIEQERDWIKDEHDGTVALKRDLAANGNKVTIVNSWKCKPTKEAFVVNGFTLKLGDHPDMEMALIKPQGKAKVVEKKVMVWGRQRANPYNMPRPVAQGMELSNVAGGKLRIVCKKPQTVEVTYDDDDNVNVRFMELDFAKTPLKTGEIAFDVEFVPGSGL